MKGGIMCVVIMFVMNTACAQDLIEARVEALGRCSVSMLEGSPFLGNPSSFNPGSRSEWATSFQRSFMLKELQHLGIGYAFPLKQGNFSFYYSRYGFALYHLDQFRLGYSMKLSAQARAGVRFRIRSEHYSGYGTNHDLIPEIGVLYTAGAKNIIGAQLVAPFPFSEETAVHAGYQQQVSQVVSIYIQGTFKSTDPPVSGFGIEYSYSKQFSIRTGYHSLNRSFCIGIGYSFGPLRVDIALSTHPYLGTSSSNSIHYEL